MHIDIYMCIHVQTRSVHPNSSGKKTFTAAVQTRTAALVSLEKEVDKRLDSGKSETEMRREKREPATLPFRASKWISCEDELDFGAFAASEAFGSPYRSVVSHGAV